jgi:glycosyltransferase involved in cell wall biosynthesis
MSVLIFHSPMPIERPLDSGSAVRPKRMLDAFRSIGQEVLVVDGDSRRRRDRWRQAMTLPPDRIHGIYSELSTTPIALTDPDHLPRAPFMDFRRLRQLRERGVPTSIYYRDIHWRFPQFTSALPLWKRTVATLFYRLELRQIRASANVVFLPSMAMAPHVPFGDPPESLAALPPGGVIRSRGGDRGQVASALRLLYVGGVSPPNYDLTLMLDAMRDLPNCSMRLCCRPKEWTVRAHLYNVPENVTIHHVDGSELDRMFEWADAMLFWCPANAYLSFSMPIKVLEALGWGLPLIVHGDTEYGRFVQDAKVGWSPTDPSDLRDLLETIRDDRSMLDAAEHHALLARAANTLEARARTVLDTLSSIRDSKR